MPYSNQSKFKAVKNLSFLSWMEVISELSDQIYTLTLDLKLYVMLSVKLRSWILFVYRESCDSHYNQKTSLDELYGGNFVPLVV